MAETVAYIADMVDQAGDLDVTDIWENSWRISNELMEKIRPVFELHRDPAYADLEHYGAEDASNGAAGSLNAFSGPEVDWLAHAWIGDFKRAFVNVHVTVWLGPHIDVPHLGIAFGTSPRPWIYLDTPARQDLNTDIAYFDKYIQPRNEHYLDLRVDPRLTQFVSRDAYIRQVLTDVAICTSLDNTPENWEFMAAEAHRHVDMWIEWVKNAEPVPAEKRADLAERDLILRRTIVQRDPANALAARRFPAGYEERLVKALWGAERETARPQA